MIRLFCFVFFVCSTQLWGENVFNWIAKDFNPLLKTHGTLNFTGHLTPQSQIRDDSGYEYSPGYRSDFVLYIDFFEWKGFISNWQISNSTIIESPDTTSFKLDRIRYTLTPGYRIELEKYIIHSWFLHECIHTISKDEPSFRGGGSLWWNGIFFGLGSKEAFHLYWIDKIRNYNPSWGLFKRLDYRFDGGAFLYGKESSWVAQNHSYRYQANSYFKFLWGSSGPWSVTSELSTQSWVNQLEQFENQIKFNTSLFLLGQYNFASIYIEYIPFDDNTHDNQSQLLSTGFKVVF